MTYRRLMPLVVLLGFGLHVRADDWPQFRGPDRTGISKEKGLLQAWPKEGPKLLWTYKNAGLGFSGPAIVGDTLYTLGGFDNAEYAIAIDLKTQRELWRTKIGALFSHGKWGDGPRSTPTVDGDRLYALGAYGDLICVDIKNKGNAIWRKSLVKHLGGQMMTVEGYKDWGYSESVLIDGDLLICTPGGDKGTLAALKKQTGEVVWRSTDLKNQAPYSSVMIHQLGDVKTYVQNSFVDENAGGFVSGFSAADGKVLWKEKIHNGGFCFAIAPTPIINDNLVYITSGYGGGCHLFEVTAAGKTFKARALYKGPTQKALKNTHGGVVLIGDYIYGHSEPQPWVCQELKTGKVKWQERAQLAGASGSITAADGRLYLLSDDGEVALLVPNPKEWDEAGTFKLPETSKLRDTLQTLQSAHVWTHPVVANGRLYLRDQELIFCYDVSAKK
jgi:outer membrane protein assembly factor BamB